MFRICVYEHRDEIKLQTVINLWDILFPLPVIFHCNKELREQTQALLPIKQNTCTVLLTSNSCFIAARLVSSVSCSQSFKLLYSKTLLVWQWDLWDIVAFSFFFFWQIISITFNRRIEPLLNQQIITTVANISKLGAVLHSYSYLLEQQFTSETPLRAFLSQ